MKFQDQMDPSRVVEIGETTKDNKGYMCRVTFQDIRDAQGKVLERGTGYAGTVRIPVALFTEEYTERGLGFVRVG